jgi:hypothetical protein
MILARSRGVIPGMRRLAPILAILTLAGCAERWTRPGATEAEAEAMNAACAREAGLTVPVVLETRIVEHARVERDRNCWTGRDGRQVCTVRERFIPARWGQVDVNAPARDAARRGCMAEKGFTFQGYRPLRLE